VVLNATGVVVTGQIAVVRGDQGTTWMDGLADGGELPGRGQHLGSDVVDVAFAEQPGGGPVGQRWVQALEPSMDDRGWSRSASSVAAW